jgi:hypothetical protein
MDSKAAGAKPASEPRVCADKTVNTTKPNTCLILHARSESSASIGNGNERTFAPPDFLPIHRTAVLEVFGASRQIGFDRRCDDVQNHMVLA